MKRETWDLLDSHLRAWPVLIGGAVGSDEIDAAERVLDRALPSDYRQFVARYGAAVVGSLPIFGLRPVAAMGVPWSVVEVNRRGAWASIRELDDWLVVSRDLAGNPIGIKDDGSVWVWDHDFGGAAQTDQDFEAFLTRQCSNSL